MRKKKILLLSQSQWGYHVDTYMYATYLKKKYDISYLCWDYGNKILDAKDINVRYISRNGSLFLRNFRYIYSAKNEIKNLSPDICFIKYFQGCSILKVTNWKKLFIFDIRTASVKKNKIRRLIYDSIMLLESKIFTRITIISESLAKKIKLEKKSHILPLGSNCISKINKQFNELKLIYIGTLDGRDILKTIEGFAIYLQKHPKVNAAYTIVGDGEDMKKIRQYVINNSLEKNIHIIGWVPFNELKPIIDLHNIGVSFVPCTDYFDCQPVTKTFDYLLSGMPVIATNTSENQKIITPFNGVCIADTPESFANGVDSIHKNRKRYNSKEIRNNAKKYDWKYIANDLDKYFDSCLSDTIF
jgi:glycosyltransferase involved in cell wall biosynthesis